MRMSAATPAQAKRSRRKSHRAGQPDAQDPMHGMIAATGAANEWACRPVCSELVVYQLSHELGFRRRDTHRVVRSSASNGCSGNPLTLTDVHSKPATHGSAQPCMLNRLRRTI